MKVIVFDLGGTLMEYRGMPLNWAEYYPEGFRAVNSAFSCGVTEEDIARSVEILKSFNPRIQYREEEYSPEFIFSKALAHWAAALSMPDCAGVFYAGLQLHAEIFPDTVPTLKALKRAGYRTAALTDLPTAMPDAFFQKDIAGLLGQLDLYVSSQSCGMRKPNPKGLRQIAEHFCVPVTELLFVGDEEKDEQTARNAGCAFLRMQREAGGDGIPNLKALLKALNILGDPKGKEF